VIRLPFWQDSPFPFLLQITDLNLVDVDVLSGALSGALTGAFRFHLFNSITNRDNGTECCAILAL
jgi:hypothetical protein